MITFWDYESLANDCEYIYTTDDMHEDAPPRSYYVSHVELTDYIRDNGLANHIEGDEETVAGREQVYEYLIDHWESVVKQYWKEVLETELDNE